MSVRFTLPLILLCGLLLAPFPAGAQRAAETVVSHPAWQTLENWSRGINSWFGDGFRNSIQGVGQWMRDFRPPRYEEFNWPGLWEKVGGGVGEYVRSARQDITSTDTGRFGYRVSEYARATDDDAPGAWVRARTFGRQVVNWLFNPSSTR